MQGPIGARAEATTAGDSGAPPGASQRIGPWDVEAELGRGAMGVVLRARHHESGLPVALKLLPPHLVGVSDHARRFEVEARAASRLRHPAVVAVVDAGEHGGRRWLAMELVDGASLDAHLRRSGPLPEEQAAELGARLARGLAHAHALDVLHRDIKPSNVLLGKDGPRLADFGLAKLTESGAGRLTASGEVLGTPPYMSPEQALGRPVDARSDVYQLGATIYETLAGRPPFQGASALEVMTAVATRPPALLEAVRPGLDPALAQVVRRAMAPRVEDRLPTAAALAEALEGWLRARSPGQLPAPRAGRRQRRRRRWALAGAAGAVLLLAGAGAVGLRPRRAAPPGPATEPSPPTTEPSPPTTEPSPPATEPAPVPGSDVERASALLAHPGPPTPAELDEALAVAPRHGPALAARAAQRLAARDYPAAVADALAAAEGDPPVERAAVARTLGLARCYLNQQEAALPDLELAFRAAPPDLELAGQTGFAARRYLRPLLAVDAFRAVRRLYRERGEAPPWSIPFNLAGALSSQGSERKDDPTRVAEIEEAYREAHALALAQTNGAGVAWPMVRLAQVLVSARRFDDAERAIADADEIARRTGHPDYALDVDNARVGLLSAQGRSSEAVDVARRVLAGRPGEFAPHLMMSNALLADGQVHEALAEAKEAQRLAEAGKADPGVLVMARAALARAEEALAKEGARAPGTER